jgi:hypothetical protein
LPPRARYTLVECQEIRFCPGGRSHRSGSDIFLLVIERDLVGVEVSSGGLGICRSYRFLKIVTNRNFVWILLGWVRWKIRWCNPRMDACCLEFDVEVSTEPPIRFQGLQKLEQRGRSQCTVPDIILKKRLPSQ